MADKSDDNNSNEVAEYLRKLCTKICPDEAESQSAYRMAVSFLANLPGSGSSGSEDVVRHRIQERVLKLRSATAVDEFSQHYGKLKISPVLKNPTAILEFLYAMGPNESPDIETQRQNVYSQLYKANQLASCSAINMNDFASELHLPLQNPVSDTNHNHADSGIGNVRSYASISTNRDPQNYQRNHTDRSNGTTSSSESCKSEREYIQEVLYAARGIGRKEPFPASQQLRGRDVLVARISELGFLHDQICTYMDPSSGCTPIGLVGEGLISAFRNELTEYYRSLAILQTEFNSCSPSHSAALTLRRLAVWSLDPLHRLKWLATIGYSCQNKKGGELATYVHRFLSHGDPRVISLVHQLLAKVCYPLYVMLCRWLLDGEIEDPYNEFFIESRQSVSTEKMWHDKYRVREAMLPAFISKQQAQRIVATGKSVTFLREVCGHKGQVAERESLKRILDNSSVELLFSGGPETKQHSVMSSAYLGVSRCLLDNLLGPHKLLQHLQALRSYLLLGQGDFIQMLMVLLEPELNKDANKLYVHNLTSILESAIRATNAQYDDPDILNRLYVNLFTPLPGDTGWDVFSLFYRVEGPLGTVLEPKAAACYRTLFMHLWRAKRMEHTLAQMWKRQTVEYKTFAKISEAMSLLRQLQALRSEMVHFVKELQYALFVVVECAWEELQAGAKKADALDQLLGAHTNFLAAVTSGALLDNTTLQLQPYIRSIYAEILSLQEFEQCFYARISEESQRRKGIAKLIVERTKRGEYGVTSVEESKSKEDLKLFKHYLAERKAHLNILSRSYRDHLKVFILQLTLQTEVNLQFLLFRLDYNDFYKRGDSKLHEPLTYQHKRLSLMGPTARKKDVH